MCCHLSNWPVHGLAFLQQVSHSKIVENLNCPEATASQLVVQCLLCSYKCLLVGIQIPLLERQELKRLYCPSQG